MESFWIGIQFGAVWLGLAMAASSCGQPDVYSYPQVVVSPAPISLSCPVPSPQPCTGRGHR